MTCASVRPGRRPAFPDRSGDRAALRYQRLSPAAAEAEARDRRRHRVVVQHQNVSWVGLLNRVRLARAVRRLER